MKLYFQIQLKRYHRKWQEIGLHSIAGSVLILLAFLLGSHYLFEKTEFAKYIYPIFALTFISGFSEMNRNIYLKSCFPTNKYYQIRLLENILFALPFVVFLFFKLEFLLGLILLVLSGLTLFAAVKKLEVRKTPTPFYRFPFEYIVGFRKYLLVYPFAYFLIYKSVNASNFNLGVFAVGFIILIHLSFYVQAENKYFVWIFNSSPKIFLVKKIVVGIIYSSLLTMPGILILGFWYSEYLLILTGVVVINTLLIISIILAKYSAYPEEMNLPQYILFALGIWMPPLLIPFILYFYLQSIKKLKPLLS